MLKEFENGCLFGHHKPDDSYGATQLSKLFSENPQSDFFQEFVVELNVEGLSIKLLPF